MRDIIEIFTLLGKRLESFGKDAESKAVIDSAIEQNAWFTRPDIERAVEAIRLDMLQPHNLTKWLSNYHRAHNPKRVAIIMAGNIPLVGFFDLLCVLCSGNEAHIKPSTKDRVLTRYIVDLLRDIEPSIPIYDYLESEHYDMAIATGGEDANRYFESHFEGTKRLLRGSRHSVAVLNGTESAEELEALMEDITTYAGLGCRSVSMIFAPKGYDITLPYTQALNPKLRRNIASIKALYTLQNIEFRDFGAFLAIEGKEFASSLAVVTIQRYNDLSEVKSWLKEHSDHIQCVVSHLDIEGCVDFGKAQHPTLWDYADGVDTMKFLE